MKNVFFLHQIKRTNGTIEKGIVWPIAAGPIHLPRQQPDRPEVCAGAAPPVRTNRIIS